MSSIFEKLDSKGISNLIATLLLIAAAVVGGAITFTAFREQAEVATGGAGIQITEAGIHVAAGAEVATVNVQNTGTVAIDNVTATIYVGDESIEMTLADVNNMDTLEPGRNVGLETTDFGGVSADSITAGESYPLVVSAVGAEGSTLEESREIYA